MPAPRQIYIAVIGVGGVGKVFLEQLSALTSYLSPQQNNPIYLSTILLARSNRLLISDQYSPLNLSNWEADLDASQTPVWSPKRIAEYLAKAPNRVVLIDNTSNQIIAESYPGFLEKGISIATPNKKAFSSSYDLWQTVKSACANGNGPSNSGYLYHESTVGAGLPVLSTLKDLVETGDEVRKIEGVFSGTMSFLFNSFQPVGGGGGRFSAEVQKAKDLGYTEPDPRDDLNGMDVARKVTILARMVGLKIESPESFPVQSLVPKELEHSDSVDDFMDKLSREDDNMEKLKKEANDEGKVVRYVGRIDVQKEELKVGLEKFDTSHPIAALQGSDNVVAIYTKRYGDRPLVIQGAGAGGEVTAMGVTADLLKILRLLH